MKVHISVGLSPDNQPVADVVYDFDDISYKPRQVETIVAAITSSASIILSAAVGGDPLDLDSTRDVSRETSAPEAPEIPWPWDVRPAEPSEGKPEPEYVEPGDEDYPEATAEPDETETETETEEDPRAR